MSDDDLGPTASGDLTDRPSEPARAGLTAPLWRMRTVVAAAVTAVALSGVGGAALAAASDGPTDGGQTRGGFGGPPGRTWGPNGQPPNGTAPFAG